MSFSETISPLIGRWALAWFYLTGAFNATHDWRAIAGHMLARHVPLPPLILMVGLVLVLLGVISLAFGYQARHGAVVLFALTFAAAMILHDYWHIENPVLRQAQFGIFARDMAICGGLLVLIGLGPGPFSIDAKAAAPAKKK